MAQPYLRAHRLGYWFLGFWNIGTKDLADAFVRNLCGLGTHYCVLERQQTGRLGGRCDGPAFRVDGRAGQWAHGGGSAALGAPVRRRFCVGNYPMLDRDFWLQPDDLWLGELQ